MVPETLMLMYDYLLKNIDPVLYEKLGNSAKLFFVTCFIQLFCNLENSDVVYTILDMIFLLGDGSTYSTMNSKDKKPVTRKKRFDRTSQLLVCIALAMTMQVRD